MNYIDTLNTFLEHRFSPGIQGAQNTKMEVAAWQLQSLLRGLSDNQFHNLISYLTDEGHVLTANAATITFCPQYIAYICGDTKPPAPKGEVHSTSKFLIANS